MLASDLKQQRPNAQQHQEGRGKEDEKGLRNGGQHGEAADKFQAAERPAPSASQAQGRELGADFLGTDELTGRPGDEA